MKRLIPYAGYERPSYRRSRKRTIDVERAVALHAEGHTWPEIGVILAVEGGVEEPFVGDSVSIAVSKKHRRETT